MVNVILYADHVVVVAIAIDDYSPPPWNLANEPNQIELVTIILLCRPLEKENDGVRRVDGQRVVQRDFVVGTSVNHDFVAEGFGCLAVTLDHETAPLVLKGPADEHQPHENRPPSHQSVTIALQALQPAAAPACSKSGARRDGGAPPGRFCGTSRVGSAHQGASRRCFHLAPAGVRPGRRPTPRGPDRA